MASLKYFLIGWICLGANADKVCVRMASEVVFPDYQQCNEYYKVAMEDFSDLNTVEFKFTCAQAGVLEDIL